VSQLLDVIINSYASLKRVKYYHQICMSSTRPNCFDEGYMCFCDRFSRADCLIFDYYNIDCRFCQNQCRCITVQKQLICVCPECYYGLLCQFRLLKYSTTFDRLLGNLIVENVAFFEMPIIVKIVVVVVILMALFGFIESLIHYHGEMYRDSELLSICHWSMIQICFWLNITMDR
jgi:hypothetical protein